MTGGRCGLFGDDLWGLCHRQLFRRLVLWAETKRSEHNRDMTLAWQIANLTNAKKLPALDRLLAKPPQERVQSMSEMKAMLHTLSQRYGGKVRVMHG